MYGCIYIYIYISKYKCTHTHPVKTIADVSSATLFLFYTSRFSLAIDYHLSSLLLPFVVLSLILCTRALFPGPVLFLVFGIFRPGRRVGWLRNSRGRRFPPEWRLSWLRHCIGKPLVWHWLPFSPFFFGIGLLWASGCLLLAGAGHDRIPIHPFSISFIQWLARAAALNTGAACTTGAFSKVATAVPGISGALIVTVIVCPVLGSG